MDSGFQVLDSGFFFSGTWIKDRADFRIPCSVILDSKVQDSGFQKKKIPGFRYNWGEYIDEIMPTVIKKLHCTKNWIYSNLLGANMLQKSANKWEIKSKDAKCRICLTVYMGL